MPAKQPRNRQPGIEFDPIAFLSTLPDNATLLQKIVPFDHPGTAVTSHRVIWTDGDGTHWQMNFELYNGRAAFRLWPSLADHSARRPVADREKLRLDLDKRGYAVANPPAEPAPVTLEPTVEPEPIVEAEPKPKRRSRPKAARPEASEKPDVLPLRRRRKEAKA